MQRRFTTETVAEAGSPLQIRPGGQVSATPIAAGWRTLRSARATVYRREDGWRAGPGRLVPIGARHATGRHRPPCTSSPADTADPPDPPQCARPPPVPAGPGAPCETNAVAAPPARPGRPRLGHMSCAWPATSGRIPPSTRLGGEQLNHPRGTFGRVG